MRFVPIYKHLYKLLNDLITIDVRSLTHSLTLKLLDSCVGLYCLRVVQ